MPRSVTRYGLPGKRMTLDKVAFWSWSRHQRRWLFFSQLNGNSFLGGEPRQHVSIPSNIYPLCCSGPLLHICFRSRSSRILIASTLVSKLRIRSQVGQASTTVFGLESTNETSRSPPSLSILYSLTFSYHFCWTWWLTWWWHDPNSQPWGLRIPCHHALLRSRLLYLTNYSNNWASKFHDALKRITWSPQCNHRITSS